jgi:hypothetical protein
VPEENKIEAGQLPVRVLSIIEFAGAQFFSPTVNNYKLRVQGSFWYICPIGCFSTETVVPGWLNAVCTEETVAWSNG